MKKEIIEEIHIEIEGTIYFGKRKIIGSNKLDQIISYNDICIVDSHVYKPEQKDDFMLTVAKQILSELITGRTLSTEPSSKYNL